MNSKEPNALRHFTEVRESFIPEGGITTIILCGKIKSEDDTSKNLNLHREIVEDEINAEEANITGLLMGQVNSFIHLIEGPCHSVLRILEKLAKKNDNDDNSIRIVYNTEDRPKRYFPEWYSCIIQELKSTVDEINDDNSVDVVHDLATKLFDIGKSLQNISQGEVELSEYTSFLPSKVLILSLSNSDLFFELKEFIKVFTSPYHIMLESENTWPLERLVNY